jgi:kinesin family protein 18/19
MIANISPSSASYEDTHNTLLYANRAKKIKNKYQRNVVNVSYHVGQYTQIIANLKEEIIDLKYNLTRAQADSRFGLGFSGSSGNIPFFDKFKNDLRHHFEDETRVRLQIEDLEKKIDEIGFNLHKLKNDAN